VLKMLPKMAESMIVAGMEASSKLVS